MICRATPRKPPARARRDRLLHRLPGSAMPRGLPSTEPGHEPSHRADRGCRAVVRDRVQNQRRMVGEQGARLERTAAGRVIVTPPPKDVPPASLAIGERVELLGRKLVAQNTFLGIEPMFKTIGVKESVLFHLGTEQLLISEGLVEKCADGRGTGRGAVFRDGPDGGREADRESGGPRRRTDPGRELRSRSAFPGGTAFDAGQQANLALPREEAPARRGCPQPRGLGQHRPRHPVGCGLQPGGVGSRGSAVEAIGARGTNPQADGRLGPAARLEEVTARELPASRRGVPSPPPLTSHPAFLSARENGSVPVQPGGTMPLTDTEPKPDKPPRNRDQLADRAGLGLGVAVCGGRRVRCRGFLLRQVSSIEMPECGVEASDCRDPPLRSLLAGAFGGVRRRGACRV